MKKIKKKDRVDSLANKLARDSLAFYRECIKYQKEKEADEEIKKWK